MKKLLLISMVVCGSLALSGCNPDKLKPESKISKSSKKKKKAKKGGTSYGSVHHIGRTKGCRVYGLYKGTNKDLRNKLCFVSKKFGYSIEVTSSCRTVKGNRSVKNSYHLYRRGCKAADIVVGGSYRLTMKVLKYWRKMRWGGTGSYSCRGFVHVDVGPAHRKWHWNSCKKNRMLRRKRKA